MENFIAQNGGIVGAAVVVMTAVAALLSGLSKFLELVLHKTADSQDGFLGAIHKISSVLHSALDWLAPRTSNKPALPAADKPEEK